MSKKMIFVSYSHNDQQFVDVLVKRLGRAYQGYEIWYDQQLAGGEDWWAEIRAKIADSAIVLMVMSDDALQSTYCTKERAIALELDKYIIPIRLYRDIDEPMPPELAQRQWVTMTHWVDNVDTWNELYRAINKTADITPAAIPTAEANDPKPMPPPSPAPEISKVWVLAVIVSMLVIGVFVWQADLFIGLGVDGVPDGKKLTATPATSTDDPTASTSNATATLSQTQSPADTPAPTSTSIFSVPTIPVLATRQINEITAYNGQVWMATNQGLVHYNTSSQLGRVVAGLEDVALRHVATTNDGLTVWVARADAPQLGRYILTEDRVVWYDTFVDVGEIADIAVDAAGVVWLGDSNGRIYTFDIRFEAALLGVDIAPQSFLYGLAYREWRDLSTLVLNGSNNGVQTITYWQDGQLSTFDDADVCRETACVFNTALMDAEGRIWVGHSAGVTLLSTALNSQSSLICPIGDTLQSQLVLGMAMDDEQSAVWVVTRSSLVRIDLTSVTTNTCTTWEWSLYADDTFWTAATGTLYQVAFDPVTQIGWVYEVGTNHIRRFK